MSMQTDVIYGYGVDTSRLSLDTAPFKAFVKKYLPNIYEKYLSDIPDDTDFNEVEKILYEYESPNCSSSGYGAVIADILQKETKLLFNYIANEESGSSAIYFPYYLPWQMTKRIKEIKQEDIDEILTRYFTELGVKIEPDYTAVEIYI